MHSLRCLPSSSALSFRSPSAITLSSFSRLSRSLLSTEQAHRRRFHSSSSTRISSAAAGAGALALSASLTCWYLSNPSSASASPSSSSSSSPSPSPSPSPVPEFPPEFRTEFFGRPVAPIVPPNTVNQLSLEELGKFYTPDSKSPLYPNYYSLAESRESAPLSLTASRSDQPFWQTLEGQLRTVQDVICQHVMDVDGGETAFRQDRTISGSGVSRVMQNGKVFEKAGVNTTVTMSQSVPLGSLRATLERLSPDHVEIRQLLESSRYQEKDSVESFTASISLVLHPHNPHVPTVHANYRYFEFVLPDGKKIWWFGGGSDLTPTYVVAKDGTHFHRTIKKVCDRFDPTYYPKFKQWADKYFVVEHRGECRGIGGVFFDDLHDGPHLGESHKKLHDFLIHSAKHFSSSYFPIVLKHLNDPFTADEKLFQQLRRGRYVEFNLVYDKGTSYGLKQPNGRPESILMSLPLTSRFEYRHTPEPGSREEETLEVLRKPKQWVEEK